MRSATLALLLLPFGDDLSEHIDGEIDRKLAASGIRPGPPADDYEFFRRVHLDLLGRLPRSEEIRAFAKSPDRGRAIDALLDSPEAARYWADRWLRRLVTIDLREGDPGVVDFPGFHGWLEKIWRERMPYDRFAALLIAAEGERDRSPEVNFLARYADPKRPPSEVAGRVGRAFLGLQLECAQCHDHPHESWTQKDFWGFAAFFANLRLRTRQTFDGLRSKLVQEGPLETPVVSVVDEGWKMSPRFLDGRSPAAGRRPREELARFMMTMPGRQFARAFVNREWAHFMGHGLVEPVDQITEKNPPSHPKLLEILAEDFEKNGYDVRRLYRAILRSRAYQASCRKEGKVDPRLYAHKPLKPQGPIEFLNNFEYALDLATFFRTFYDQYRGNKDLPESYKNPVVFRVYMTQFIAGVLAPGGRAPEEIPYTGSSRLALKLMNNRDLHGLMSAQWGHLKRTLETLTDPGARLEEIFLTLLSRPPDDAERKRYLEYVSRKRGEATAYEDLYWVLVNSPEFFFNH